MTDDDVENKVWRICEVRWAAHLEEQRWTVDLVRPFRQDDPAGAPMIRLSSGREVRRPDIRASKGGQVEFWEVKYRTRADTNPVTGAREFWMARAAYEDYYRLAVDQDGQVWVALRAEGDHLRAPRWLVIDVRRLAVLGYPDKRTAAHGEQLDAWVWPESEMRLVNGPSIEFDVADRPVLPEETSLAPEAGGTSKVPSAIPLIELQDAERLIRSEEPNASATERALRVVADPMVALDVLRRRAGLAIPELPKYSVLRISEDDVNIDDLLGLLNYGIRVFLVTSKKMADEDRKKFLPFIASRLLEWSYCAGKLPSFWAVDGICDGKRLKDWPAEITQILKSADDNGGINIGQYEVVHMSSDSDIVITAGAGTGKTETMSERIIYLLATSALLELRQDQNQYPYDLRMTDIVLVTFTREAAAQMRERLARVLNLRRRLSRDCVLAAVPWMLQLGGTQISTIHQYARLVAQESAATIGLTPGLSVGAQTLDLRRILHTALSEHLIRVLENPELSGTIPPSHEWLKFLEDVWQVLGNNGIEFLPIGIDPSELPPIDWGTEDLGDDASKEIATITRDVVLQAGRLFADLCMDNGVLPIDQLVPSALRGLLRTSRPRMGRPRYLFVDEFQDTDGKQMDLILAIREKLDARLFVVGDVKQGIYHFRGAEGSAFLELKARIRLQQARAKAEGHPALPDLNELNLVRNFRTGGELLKSLDKCFRVWGGTPAQPGAQSSLLDYGDKDVLKPEVERAAAGVTMKTKVVPHSDFEDEVVKQIQQWLPLAEAEKKKIGILCRQNWMANKIRIALRSRHLPCEVLVGGQFYQSSAVREARVLLDAISSPNNTAALLELCETRWFGGIAMKQQPPSGREADRFWDEDPEPILSWSDRLFGLGDRSSNNLLIDDLEWLKNRLHSLRKLQATMSPVALLAQCNQKFKPHQWVRLNDTNDPAREREQYQLCLEHLLVLLDVRTEARPSTLPVLTDWLRLQIATNDKEDEPQPETLNVVTALTVHKAKGQEFDYVLIPNTWAPFESSSAASQVRIVRADPPNTTPKLLWTWRAGLTFSNHDPSSSAAIREYEETRREETRLLYVAMTRAREELRIFVSNSRKIDTWGELLEMAGH